MNRTEKNRQKSSTWMVNTVPSREDNHVRADETSEFGADVLVINSSICFYKRSRLAFFFLEYNRPTVLHVAKRIVEKLDVRHSWVVWRRTEVAHAQELAQALRRVFSGCFQNVDVRDTLNRRGHLQNLGRAVAL